MPVGRFGNEQDLTNQCGQLRKLSRTDGLQGSGQALARGRSLLPLAPRPPGLSRRLS